MTHESLLAEPTPPPVQAEFVIKDVARPQPRREYSTRRESSAQRLARRQRILDLFFVHRPGSRREHEQQALKLIHDEVLDDDERQKLRGFVSRIISVIQSVEP